MLRDTLGPSRHRLARLAVGATLVVALLPAAAASACDICSVYTLLEAREMALGLYAGVSEQYSDFGTLMLDGREVDNEDGQSLDSSITQVVVGYEIDRRWGIQVNVPLIQRSFRRPEGGELESGTESGLGDVSATAHWRVFERYGTDAFVVDLLGGVKLPTGNSDRLAEELAEGHDHGDEGEAGDEGHDEEGDHGHEASGIHGHDLALGSGSVDGLVGVSAHWSHGRLFSRARIQYAIRSEGDFDFRYGNDLTWNVEPGVFLLLEHDRTLSLGVSISGEHKGEDSLAGNEQDDTAIDTLYAGPSLAFSWRSKLYAEAAYDLPVSQDNSGLQLVPDSRLRAAVTWRF